MKNFALRGLPGLFVFLFFFVGILQAHAFLGFGSARNVTAKDGFITVNTSKLKNGESQHYTFHEKDTKIRFFIVRDERGVVRAALDACDVCYAEGKGYKADNKFMICVNCGQRFALTRIGQVRGGCNPHPVVFTNNNNLFTVTAEELLKGAKYFPENR